MEEKKIYNESKLDEVFLSYDKILFRLNIQEIKSKEKKDITHKDLRKAITVMQMKHKNCRWKSEKIRSKNSYILIEGYYTEKLKTKFRRSFDFFFF